MTASSAPPVTSSTALTTPGVPLTDAAGASSRDGWLDIDTPRAGAGRSAPATALRRTPAAT